MHLPVARAKARELSVRIAVVRVKSFILMEIEDSWVWVVKC